jgi:hypothetical protein
MQGKSLATNKTTPTSDDRGYDDDDEAIIRDRLSGLGYIG